MKKRNVRILILLMVIFSVIPIYYLNRVNSHQLPEIKEDILLEKLGLSFIREENTLNHSDKLMLSSNIESISYQEVLKQLNGNNQEQLQGIEHLKSFAENEPENMEYLNRLRLIMNSLDMTEAYINFLEEMPVTLSTSLQKSLSYVDLLQSPDLGIAVLGQTSSKSIKELERILEENPYNWLAHYARGLNNLYWPSGLMRTEIAIEDLSYCLAVVKVQEDKGIFLEIWPLTYKAYGDSLVKDGRTEEGMQVWKKGHKNYPEDRDLEIRSKANKKEAFAIVKKERGIEIFQRPDPNITDMSILWK